MLALPTVVYHLAEGSNWPAIQRDGLHPATVLLARSGLPPGEQQRLNTTQRTTHTALPDGTALRDQKPMPPDALARCLVGCTPAEWYALINARVFFWFDVDRLDRQRRACAPRAQVLLAIDATRLIADYRAHAALSPINTGNARRRPAVRGRATFVPISEWERRGWASEAEALGTTPRARSHAPVELTITSAIPDIGSYIVKTIRLTSTDPLPPDVT
ncbi:MAG: hypothetical protein MUF00_00520 [Gemmatimonadaceae bacterium]|nr:hypothetical protein [Gemmatimonadaceae bacterium]